MTVATLDRYSLHTGPVAAPVARVHPRTVEHCYLTYIRVLRDPKDDRHGVGGRGGHGRGTERSCGRQEGWVQQDEGARGDHKNNLPLGGRVLGHVRLYGERGRGGQTETGTTSINEGPRVSTKGTLRLETPVNAERNSRPSRGAPSPTHLHPHPIQVPPTAQVGGENHQTVGRRKSTRGSMVPAASQSYGRKAGDNWRSWGGGVINDKSTEMRQEVEREMHARENWL